MDFFIQPVKRPNGVTSYYMYDYIFDLTAKKHKRIYIGKVTVSEYNRWKAEHDVTSKFCKRCGQRKKIIVPSWLKSVKMKKCECD